MEQFDYVLQVATIGFLVVLVTLFLLYLLLCSFKRFLASAVVSERVTIDKSIVTERFENDRSPTEKPVSKEVVSGGSSSDEQLVDNRKVVAAITAAVTSFLEEQVPSYKAGKITVSREPSPTTSKNNWKMAGRRNLLQNRLKLEKIRRNKQRENI